MARQLGSLFDDVSEVVDLLRAEDITQSVKYEVLTNHGMRLGSSTFRSKLQRGCFCDWCQEWMKEEKI